MAKRWPPGAAAAALAAAVAALVAAVALLRSSRRRQLPHVGQTGGGAAAPPPELVEVSSAELPGTGGLRLRLQMPESERGIMKEVVATNAYGFLPGKSSSALLQPGDALLDIGAHVGVASALALCTPHTRVACVEPHPVTFEVLRTNLAAHGGRVALINKAVSDSAGPMPLFPHRGTRGRPARLFFASLFASRPHEEEGAISVECVRLQDLIDSHDPTVVKIDAEGAERFLLGVQDFRRVRALVVEWDWTHNGEEATWLSLRAHLAAHGFAVKIKGHMPSFDAAGRAVLVDGRGKKKGSTGMIFAATRRAPAG